MSMVNSLQNTSTVRDRLVTTLFAAALVHGIVIAGITFSSRGDAAAAPDLDVVLVTDEVPAAEHNDAARYLAQRSQLGGGSTRDKVPPRSQSNPPRLPRLLGDPQGTTPVDRHNSAADSDEPILATTSPQPTVRWLGDVGSEPRALGPMPLLLDAPDATGAPGRNDDASPQLSGPNRDELWITPDTRASRLAPWLDAWRRKVERLGTMNYPMAARRTGLRANPVLEVSIRSDGTLEEAHVSRSSGHGDVDQAALNILKLASPFDAFPAALADTVHVLHFSYEWQFDSGAGSSAALAVPTPPP